MSILTKTIKTPIQIEAEKILTAPQNIADVLLREIADPIDRLWGSSNPQEILDEIGTDAASLFEINSKFAGAITTLLTQEGDTERLNKLNALINKIKPHTINEDGSVTIDPEPEPEVVEEG